MFVAPGKFVVAFLETSRACPTDRMLGLLLLREPNQLHLLLITEQHDTNPGRVVGAYGSKTLHCYTAQHCPCFVFPGTSTCHVSGNPAAACGSHSPIAAIALDAVNLKGLDMTQRALKSGSLQALDF